MTRPAPKFSTFSQRRELIERVAKQLEAEGEAELAATVRLTMPARVEGDRLVLRYGQSRQGWAGAVQSNAGMIEACLRRVGAGPVYVGVELADF